MILQTVKRLAGSWLIRRETVMQRRITQEEISSTVFEQLLDSLHPRREMSSEEFVEEARRRGIQITTAAEFKEALKQQEEQSTPDTDERPGQYI